MGLVTEAPWFKALTPGQLESWARLVARYGDFAYRDLPGTDAEIAIDEAWQKANLAIVELPGVGKFKVHAEVITNFERVFDLIWERTDGHPEKWIEVAEVRGAIAGAWSPRHTLHKIDRPLSLHSWGIAIDLNVARNGYGQPSHQPPEMIEAFRMAGFRWGGDFRVPDPMHFEVSG